MSNPPEGPSPYREHVYLPAQDAEQPQERARRTVKRLVVLLLVGMVLGAVAGVLVVATGWV